MLSTAHAFLSYPLQLLRYLFPGDDRPVIMDGDVNIWPPHITLRKIERALEGRLPDEEDGCASVSFLDYGASHVVVSVKTLRQNTYVVRITAIMFEEFQERHPFWQSFKESSEVASMIVLKKMTNIPVPRVYVLDEDKGNTLGGAWTLQQYMEGTTLGKLLPELSPTALVQAIEQLADWMLQVFHLDFGSQIGSLHCTGDFKDSRNLSESNLEIHVGPIVTLQGLRHPYLVGPPETCGPWDDARSWLKSVAQGDMMYRAQGESEVDQEYIERVKAIIDEPPEANGLFLTGSLSKTAPWATDMWSPQNIKAVVNNDGSLTLVALLDMEGMQIVPRWVLGRAPRIGYLGVELCNMLLDRLLEDPEYKQAHEDGRKARHLLHLAQGACFSDPDDRRIKEFREGVWEDEARMAG